MQNKKRERLLFVINDLSIGGAERVILNSISQLSKKYDVHVFTLMARGPLEAELLQYTQKTYSITMPSLTYRSTVWKIVWIFRLPLTFVSLLKILITKKPVAVISSLFLADVISMPLARLVGIKKRVVIQHDIHSFGVCKNFIKVQCGLGNATKIIAVSESVKDFLYATWSQPLKKISIIQNGINTSLFKNGRKKITGKDPLVVGYLGRLEPIKGPQYLLEAAVTLAKKGFMPKIIIGGYGSLDQELQNYAYKHHLSHIDFFGIVTDAAAFLSKVDILIIPSEEEGFGLIALEGLFAHKVIIASDLEAFRELLTTNKNSILFPPKESNLLASAIQKIYTDTSLYKKIKNNVVHWAAKNEPLFNIEHKGEEYKKILTQK